MTETNAWCSLVKYFLLPLFDPSLTQTTYFFKLIKGNFWGPMPIMIWIAILIEAIQADWTDFAVLLGLQVQTIQRRFQRTCLANYFADSIDAERLCILC